MSVGALNSLPNREYSNLYNVVAFSSMSFSGKTSLADKHSYLLTFPDDKAEFLTFCLQKNIELYLAQFCYRLFQFFSLTVIFISSS